MKLSSIGWLTCHENPHSNNSVLCASCYNVLLLSTKICPTASVFGTIKLLLSYFTFSNAFLWFKTIAGLQMSHCTYFQSFKKMVYSCWTGLLFEPAFSPSNIFSNDAKDLLVYFESCLNPYGLKYVVGGEYWCLAGKTFDFICYCFIRARWFRMKLDLPLKIGFWVLCFKNLGNEIFILKVFCLTVRTTEVFFI